jgi:dihydrofolate reductase
LSLSNEEIVALIDSYEKEARAIKEEAIKMIWFMRGGITYNEAMMLGVQDRELIAKLIKSNIETTKESGLPFF